MIGIGLPIGPPRYVQEAVPVPRPPQVYVPQPRPEQPQQPQVQHLQGPKGERGEQGPAGPQGEPGLSVKQEQVEAIVNAWLDSNIEQLRGPEGPEGPVGPAGDSANVATLEKRISDIERKKFRILITNGSKVVDDESYDLATMQDKPVILDLNRLRNVSGN